MDLYSFLFYLSKRGKLFLPLSFIIYSAFSFFIWVFLFLLLLLLTGGNCFSTAKEEEGTIKIKDLFLSSSSSSFGKLCIHTVNLLLRRNWKREIFHFPKLSSLHCKKDGRGKCFLLLWKVLLMWSHLFLCELVSSVLFPCGTEEVGGP